MVRQDTNRIETFKNSLNAYLMAVSRKVLKLDHREEILKFLAETIQERLESDLIAIALKEDEKLALNYVDNKNYNIQPFFPYLMSDIPDILFEKSIDTTHSKELRETFSSFKTMGFHSWFTIPLVDEEDVYGICIVAFEKPIDLYEELSHSFSEFGGYTAIALSLIKKNEYKERRLRGMEWISQNLIYEELGSEVIENVVTFSGKETKANGVAIYLLDESDNVLSFQEPFYGHLKKDNYIEIEDGEYLESYFPYMDKLGYNQIGIPLMVEMEIIGVLHAEKPLNSIFTGHDLEILKIYGDYFSTVYENNQLAAKEKQQMQQLDLLIQTQEAMLKETIKENNFAGINTLLGDYLSRPVVLYDSFFNLMSYHTPADEGVIEEEFKEIGTQLKQMKTIMTDPFKVELSPIKTMECIPISGGGELHGFLLIEVSQSTEDDLVKLILNMANNIYSVKFITQKIGRQAVEEIKGSFVKQLLIKQIDDIESIIDYANAFQWDLYKPYQTAVLKVSQNNYIKKENLLEERTYTKNVFKRIKRMISDYDSNIITASDQNQLIMFSLVNDKNPHQYWEGLQNKILSEMEKEQIQLGISLGIGGVATHPEEYYDSYQKALQAANVLQNSDSNESMVFFDKLGYYTVLNRMKDDTETVLFIEKYLKQLYKESAGKNVDLFKTLKVYLNNNGNVKQTAEKLYLHRSTLTYRLERIQEILQMDIDDSEIRFNLMLAYKLFDLYDNDLLKE